jgi:hypothetical protein
MLSPIKATFVDKRGLKLFQSSKRDDRGLEVFIPDFSSSRGMAPRQARTAPPQGASDAGITADRATAVRADCRTGIP